MSDGGLNIELPPDQFAVGVPLEVRDAFGELLRATAVSCSEGTHEWDSEAGRWKRIHDFPVVWVLFDDAVGWDPVPWPLADVRILA